MALRTRIALFLAALSIVATGAAGASAAYTGSATLSITPTANDQYVLVASGRYPAFYLNGVDVAIRLWGDDEWYDDLLYTVPGTIFEGPWDMHFERSFILSGSVLNEDWGWDEIYAEARLYDHKTGKLLQTIETNRLYGQWS